MARPLTQTSGEIHRLLRGTYCLFIQLFPQIRLLGNLGSSHEIGCGVEARPETVSCGQETVVGRVMEVEDR